MFLIKFFVLFFFFKQKTAYEIVSRDWSSDVCSSDLVRLLLQPTHRNKFNVFAALVRYDNQREACISTFNLRRRQRIQWDDGESFVTLNLGPGIDCYINFCRVFFFFLETFSTFVQSI